MSQGPLRGSSRSSALAQSANQPLGLRAMRQAEPQGREDWSFTPQEFDSLRRSGGGLRFAADSEWLPAPFRANLLSTLQALLDPTRRPAATEAVSVIDLYHAHVELPVNTALPVDLQQALRQYHELARTIRPHYREEQLNRYSIPMFAGRVAELAQLAATLLALVARQPGAAVIYHSFEVNVPNGMHPGDPRRNYVTPLDSNIPRGFARAADDGELRSVYQHIFDIEFLIDRFGVIHVRPGEGLGMTAMAAITGQREGGLAAVQQQTMGTRPPEPPSHHAVPPSTLVDRLGPIMPPSLRPEQPIPSRPLRTGRPPRR